MNWKEVIPQGARDVLSFVQCVHGDKLLVAFIRDVVDVLELYNLQGEKLFQFTLPGLGTIVSMTGTLACFMVTTLVVVLMWLGRKKSAEIFYKYSSFLSPGTTFQCDFDQDGQVSQPRLFQFLPIHLVSRIVVADSAVKPR